MTKQSVRQVEAVVLLAGGLRPPQLALAAGRSLLDLYLTPTQSVLDLWCDRFSQLRTSSGDVAQIRVVYDRNGPPPTPPLSGDGSRVSFRQEARTYRGPAGALRDACVDLDKEASILVSDAGRFIDVDLAAMLDEHAERGADITLACDGEGTPIGLYLMRKGVLDLIPGDGFIDIKEQLLPQAAQAGLGVWIHRLSSGGSHPLRTRRLFLRTARIASCLNNVTTHQDGELIGPYRPDDKAWGFRIVAPDARIAPDALVADSIVMPGATVGSGALVARSIVCPGARVEPGMEVVDAVMSARGVRSDDWAGAKGAISGAGAVR